MTTNYELLNRFAELSQKRDELHKQLLQAEFDLFELCHKNPHIFPKKARPKKKTKTPTLIAYHVDRPEARFPFASLKEAWQFFFDAPTTRMNWRDAPRAFELRGIIIERIGNEYRQSQADVPSGESDTVA